jgi:uncharacterized protein (DUF433 family)
VLQPVPNRQIALSSNLHSDLALLYPCLTMGTKLSAEEVVTVSTEIMHGVPCFAGTRVPVQTLLDYIAEGDTIDAFLGDFPSVKREQAISFLALAQERFLKSISSR